MLYSVFRCRQRKNLFFSVSEAGSFFFGGIVVKYRRELYKTFILVASERDQFLLAKSICLLLYITLGTLGIEID